MVIDDIRYLMSILSYERAREMSLVLHQLSRAGSKEARFVDFPQVRNLTEEVQSLHEDVSKLTRALQAAQEAQQQTQEHLHMEEEKLSNVSEANQKLAQQIDVVSKSGLYVSLSVCLCVSVNMCSEHQWAGW